MSGDCGNTAKIPTKLVDVQGDKRWEDLHQEYCHQSKEKEANVIFIGDSLVLQMSQYAECDSQLAPLHCLNFGIGGDRTEHVLWRIENGVLDNINTKVVVIWCGTNNHGNTPSQIANGILAIADLVLRKQPECTVIIMSILPRGKYPNPLRERNSQANELVQKLVSNRSQVRYFDITEGFVSSEGTVSISDMYDYLHLTRHGYEKIISPLVDEIKSILGD
uniref:platelet-activating factor acetylhydrolase IB subunit alpha1-like n=1 Tax=Styela clava TaxID=7725 RepID=UPI00193A645B|nr:platelet-activating factor acetylhydrolase IB subunit alpha1-like [Styela clava]